MNTHRAVPCARCLGTGWCTTTYPKRGSYTRHRCRCPVGLTAPADIEERVTIACGRIDRSDIDEDFGAILFDTVEIRIIPQMPDGSSDVPV